MEVDHVVLWVSNPKLSLEFYIDVLGFEPVRLEEFEAGSVPFPSVRLNDRTIFDLMDRRALVDRVRDFTGGSAASVGNPINHVCMSTSAEEFQELYGRLERHGVHIQSGGEKSFGAQGHAIKSVYFNDPDENVLELRYYAKGE